MYNPNDHYWIVEGQIYASNRGIIISADDPTFLAWQELGLTPTTILSFAELKEVLQHANVPLGEGVFTSTPQEQISLLESTVTARMLREAALGIDTGRLQAVNDKIALLRAQIQH